MIKSLDCIVENVCLRFVTHACQHLDPHHLNENTRSAAFRRSAPLGWKCLHIIGFPIYQNRDLAMIPLLKIAIHLFSAAFRFPPRFANCLFRGLSIQFTHFSSRWKSLFQQFSSPFLTYLSLCVGQYEALPICISSDIRFLYFRSRTPNTKGQTGWSPDPHLSIYRQT